MKDHAWIGSCGNKMLTGILCTFDTLKQVPPHWTRETMPGLCDQPIKILDLQKNQRNEHARSPENL